MVTPNMLIAGFLAFAFLLPVIYKWNKTLSKVFAFTGLLAVLAVTISWFLGIFNADLLITSTTAGFPSPLSIKLFVGSNEVLALLLVNIIGLFSLWYLMSSKLELSGKVLALMFTLMLGANGLIMTQDLFNIFVFLEISSISLFGLLTISSDKRIFEAGFKYMIATGIASAFYLIGLAFVYRAAGTLDLDILKSLDTLGYLPLLLLAAGILIELKPFPANGWALDTYEAADSTAGALISAVNTSALLMVFYKLSPLFSAEMLQIFAFSGMATFLLSQLMAMKQVSVKRMLGYSSIAQTGLILFVFSFSFIQKINFAPLMGLFFLVNHGLAKAALFWFADLLKNSHVRREGEEGFLRKNRVYLIGIAIAVSALVALPPSPAFWAKWQIVNYLGNQKAYLWMAALLIGSLLEAAYLFRWFLKLQADGTDKGSVFAPQVPGDFEKTELPVKSIRFPLSWAAAAPVLSVLLLLALGSFMSLLELNILLFLPIAAFLIFAVLDFVGLPFWLKNLAAMSALLSYGYLYYPSTAGIKMLFGLMFIGAALIQMFIFFNRKDKSRGLLPLFLMMVLSLGNLLFFKTRLEFFFSWETMTLASFFLIVRGKQASGASLRYILFSLAGAFAMLFALAMAEGNTWGEFIQSADTIVPGLLFGFGVLAKLGALGMHIWLPASYAEAEDDVSSILSSVLSKAGIFLLFLTFGLYTRDFVPNLIAGLDMSQVLGWLGVVTALAGAFMALFQEDIKYTLAYSSMGQIGYMLLGFAMYSHLGWVTAIYLGITHLFFKGLLFLAIAGVILRVKTRLMYQMGGLIKKMPISFISVLLAIIALSGVPPLTGFGGKWLLYSALLEKGWYLQAALAMFASGVAFLYLFRLIHSIFLGQPKPEHAEVKEAPIWGLIPQVGFMAAIMAFSMYPNLILKPIQAAVEPFFPVLAQSGTWEGATVFSSLGYWNGSAVMYVTMGVFAVPLIWLLIVQGKAQPVKQFNIVYAAERPYKPSTTHFAYNFFSHYEKALGFLGRARITAFYTALSSWVHTIGSALRRLYSGNAQTYALFTLLYVLILHLMYIGGPF
jgi:formate hydrogenlyase subunit 3/multisubunit Na+/H+ antiporter MnhD subunit